MARGERAGVNRQTPHWFDRLVGRGTALLGITDRRVASDAFPLGAVPSKERLQAKPPDRQTEFVATIPRKTVRLRQSTNPTTRSVIFLILTLAGPKAAQVRRLKQLPSSSTKLILVP